MESFRTKKELLEFIWKNPDDRKLVDRLIAKGSVWMEEWMYCTNMGPVHVGADEWEVVRLENEVRGLRKKLEERTNIEPKDDLYDHLVFFYERFLARKSFVDGKVFGQSQYNNQQWKQDTMEMVQPEVYARYGFTYWEMEKAECEFVQGLINDKLDELPF